ncbi:MAG: hypothetical protein HGA41_05080 [Syntrophaceae bacterium]|nr:hypothetical protein [Syntrophaceae bacterium]
MFAGLPGHNGDYYFFVVRRESQAELLEKLNVVNDKLKEFVLASGSEQFME